MRDGLVFERKGSGDDTDLLVKVRIDGIVFDTRVYVGQIGLERDSASLSEFAQGCLTEGGPASMELILGPDLDSAPHAAVQLKALQRGYLLATVQLWRPVPSNDLCLTDLCKVHFATDIASLDAFAAQCQLICQGDRPDASLAGLSAWAIGPVKPD